MNYYIKLILLMLSVSLFCIQASADVYKWKDAKGIWRYSDVPPKESEGVVKFRTSSIKKQKTKDADLEKKLAERNNAPQVEGDQLVVEKEDLAIKKQNCAGARANYVIYENGGRIKRANANGEMSYLTEEEILASKAKAQKDIDTYCS